MRLNDISKSERQQEQLQLFRRLIMTMNKGLVIVRLGRDDACELEVLEINPAAMKMLGIPTPDFALKDLPEGSCKLFDCEHARQYAEILRNGRERGLGEFCRVGREDQANCFAVRALPLSDLHLGILLEDITPIKEAENAVSALRSMCARLQSVLDANTLLDILIQESASALHAESGVAGFCTPEGISCFRYLCEGVLVSPDRCRAPDGEILCRMIVAETPYRIEDAAKDPRVDKERATTFGVRSAIGTPIFYERSDMVGFLELHNKIGAPGFSTMDEEQLAVIEQIASIAMRSSVDYQKILEMGRNLHESRERYQLSESRFRSTFEGAGFGIALLDQEGNIIETNPALEQLLSYSETELRAVGFFALNHPEDREADLVHFREMMDGKIDGYQMEKRFIHKDGRTIWVRLIVSLIRDRSGTSEYAIGMAEDITERKKSEVEIAELLAQVKQNAAELESRVAMRTAQLEETNAELKSFAYTVSHDLRAPLRAVQGYAEIIAAESAISQEGRDFLERILAAARRMDFLIQDLLAYSRLSMQDIVLTRVSLQKVVSDALAHLHLESGGKEYRIEVAQDLPEVHGHSGVLTQVVLNLLSNGIKFVSPHVIPQLRIWAAGNAEYCRLYIKDNGIGISAEHQRRIFQVFERLHGTEVYPGTGIGLAIARKGVLRLGGRIGVESELGQGSIFWIDLPRADHETDPEKGI